MSRTNDLFPVLLLIRLLLAPEELFPPKAALGLEGDPTKQIPSAGPRTAALGHPWRGGSHCSLQSLVVGQTLLGVGFCGCKPSPDTYPLEDAKARRKLERVHCVVSLPLSWQSLHALPSAKLCLLFMLSAPAAFSGFTAIRDYIIN